MSAGLGAMGPIQRDILGELQRWYDAGAAEAWLLALREEIAHGLAERQQKFVEANFTHSAAEYRAAMMTADLIDPHADR